MKTLLLSLLLLSTFQLRAQSDTDSTAGRQTAMFDLLHRETDTITLLFKWNAMAPAPVKMLEYNQPYQFSNLPDRQFLLLELELEQALPFGLSLRGGMGLITGASNAVNLSYDDVPAESNWSRFFIESRFFPRGRHCPAARLSNGAYLGVQLASSSRFGPQAVFFDESNPPIEKSIGLSAGLHYRLHHRCYFDFQYTLRRVDRKVWNGPGFQYIRQRSWALQPHLSMGLALHRRPADARAVRREWLRLARTDTRKGMWRIGLLKALYMPQLSGIYSEVPIEYERRLGRSACSVVGGGLFQVNKFDFDDQAFWKKSGFVSTAFQFKAACRVYLPSFPAGKRDPVSVFSDAWYWSMQTAWGKQYTGWYSGHFLKYAEQQQVSVFSIAGRQLRVARHAYVGYEAGFGREWLNVRTFTDHGTWTGFRYGKWSYFAALNAGLTF